MSKVVLDASAVLAVLHAEAGAPLVEPHMADSLMSSVNLAEVGARLSDRGVPIDTARALLTAMGMQVISFDAPQAFASAALRAKTRTLGLSLGDRACLALAERERLPILTADRAWSKLDLGIEVRLIRSG